MLVPKLEALLIPSCFCLADDILSLYGSPLPGEILRTRIELTAGCCRLGLQLSGQIGKEPTDNFTCGVFVAGILPDGAAANNGVIRVGDQILKVNLTCLSFSIADESGIGSVSLM